MGKTNGKKKDPMKLVLIIRDVFSKINVVACGPLPTTPSGKKYLITAMSLASKYPDAVPVEDITSTSVADELMQVFSRLGLPKIIQMGQGRSFTTQCFLQKFGVKLIHSSFHHSQSNSVERFHRTVKRILRVLCLVNRTNWEQVIYPALFPLRTVVHESTGFSPAELVHG
ncbi:hypothetical protein AVEN_228099-1 [Araneus ventricosus]|uniref:Integrase catalytic domain-containing protein n=1 Tax=Araneus ventricosus TaxID=182803 RepID=A0A4Y2LE92_ARAVE|nr:hypothetical protein AVEN_228099-1 [Araneus ventricosus]